MSEDAGMPDDVFTIIEATHYVGASRWTLEKYHLRGQLPGTRTIGGTYLFRRGDLDMVRPIIAANKELFRTEQSAAKRRKKVEADE